MAFLVWPQCHCDTTAATIATSNPLIYDRNRRSINLVKELAIAFHGLNLEVGAFDGSPPSSRIRVKSVVDLVLLQAAAKLQINRTTCELSPQSERVVWLSCCLAVWPVAAANMEKEQVALKWPTLRFKFAS